MSSYFRSRRGIHHMMIMRVLDRVWNFFWHSTLSLKLVFLGAVCVVIGLVMPWATVSTASPIYAFSFAAGGVGWIMSIILIAVLITLFSYDLHEKTKKHFGIVLDPRFIYLRSGFLIVLLTLVVNLTFIGSARFGPEITTLAGVIMTLIGGICLTVGGKLVQKAEEKQSYKHIFVQGVEHDEDAAYKKIL
jgi:hypothetical protein